MAWFEKKPDAKPDDKSDGDLLIEKLTGVIDAKLSPISAKVEDINTRWNALETAASKKNEPPPNDPPARVSVLDNEDEAFAQRLGPIMYQTVLTNARMVERDIYDEMKEGGWSELLPEVKKHLDATDVQRKSKADYAVYCRNVMDMVIGQKARSSGLRQREGTFYLETGNTRGADGDKGNRPELNWQDQRGRVHTGDEVASKLGLTSDDVKAIAGSEFLA